MVADGAARPAHAPLSSPQWPQDGAKTGQVWGLQWLTFYTAWQWTRIGRHGTYARGKADRDLRTRLEGRSRTRARKPATAAARMVRRSRPPGRWRIRRVC